ncbi:hypothetical protein GA0074696_4091 [Micromonospora purpureochromogenes]|uniref:Uncharacterized protein n=1 Tax=Micromonospora purpureochromogenes TaxID=47872 RepID=A0A1C4Z6F7_9ACTN|nr:hypothetical protein [Micromonospora purpureochromogenes]SCF28545.1 hypothetical protein GA0074696_4091 [Micromonospora purpureochromogenes]
MKVRLDVAVNASLIRIPGMLGSRVAVSETGSCTQSLHMMVAGRSAEASPGAVIVQVAAVGSPARTVLEVPSTRICQATLAVGKKFVPWTVSRPPTSASRVVKSA